MGNVAVLLIAGCIYGMNVALYSIIFQYASTQMINMMYKRYDKDTLFIITKKPDEVYNIILKRRIMMQLYLRALDVIRMKKKRCFIVW